MGGATNSYAAATQQQNAFDKVEIPSRGYNDGQCPEQLSFL
jgi:hypothetical protein